MAKNYYEERGIKKRTCEINRLVGGCTGIRRSTGQHPGGIVVLPLGEDINSFTPVQLIGILVITVSVFGVSAQKEG